MSRKSYAAALVIVALVVAHRPMQARRPSGPVQVTSSPDTSGMKTGDEVTSTIHLLALENLNRLEVTLSVVDGVEIVSGPTTAVFDDVKQDETRDIEVRVRLTGPKYGDVAIVYQALVGDKTRAGTAGVTYGNPKN
jgi:hypothetical protein